MDLLQDILERLDYDLWANRQWVSAIGNLRNSSQAQEVIDHIFTAHRAWLERCGIVIEQSQDNVALESQFEAVHAGWVRLLKESSLDRSVSYTNTLGQSYRNTVRQIMDHAINHATYHRGHLRGLADAEGNEAFPETDLIRYYREFA